MPGERWCFGCRRGAAHPAAVPCRNGEPVSGAALCTSSVYFTLQDSAVPKAALSTALAPNPGDLGRAPSLHFPRSHLFGCQGRSLPPPSKTDQNKEVSYIINKMCPIFIIKHTPTPASIMEPGCYGP